MVFCTKITCKNANALVILQKRAVTLGSGAPSEYYLLFLIIYYNKIFNNCQGSHYNLSGFFNTVFRKFERVAVSIEHEF